MEPLSGGLRLSHACQKLSFQCHNIGALRLNTKGAFNRFHALSDSSQLFIRHGFIIISVCFTAV